MLLILLGWEQWKCNVLIWAKQLQLISLLFLLYDFVETMN